MVQNLVHLSDSFTRPANTTAYGANDLVANSTTAGSVVPLSFKVPVGMGKAYKIIELHIEKTGTTTANAQFTAHFYTASPTAANGDNGAWSTDLSGYFGSISLTSMYAFTDGAAGVNSVGDASALCDTTRDNGAIIYVLLQADAAYVPASGETFTVSLGIELFPG